MPIPGGIAKLSVPDRVTEGPERFMNARRRACRVLELACLAVGLGLTLAGCAASGGRQAYFESRGRVVQPRMGDGSAILSPSAPPDSLANARDEMPAELVRP